MKTEYLLVDFDKIVKYDFTSNEKINMEELLSTSNLPEEYKKFVLCHHRGFNVNFYMQLTISKLFYLFSI